MSDEAAFLRAILAEPDDDAPRLVFADWLDEQDDPQRSAWAAFIRRQCEFARLPRWHRRWQELFYHHQLNKPPRSTAFPVPALPDGLFWDTCPFERGFPARLQVASPEAFPAHASAVLETAPVHELVFQRNHG